MGTQRRFQAKGGKACSVRKKTISREKKFVTRNHKKSEELTACSRGSAKPGGENRQAKVLKISRGRDQPEANPTKGAGEPREPSGGKSTDGGLAKSALMSKENHKRGRTILGKKA